MQKKRAFTLLEVLIVIFVLATGIMVVIQGVNKTTSYISESAQRTIALNLAKEGIEAVYNIRNTNWRKWPNQKDECRLVANPREVGSNPRGGESSESCVAAEKLTGANYFSLVGQQGEVRTSVFPRAKSAKDHTLKYGWLNQEQFKHFKDIFQVLEQVDFNPKYDKPAEWENLKNLIVYYKPSKERVSVFNLKNIPDAKDNIDRRYGRYYRDIVILGVNPKKNDKNADFVCRDGDGNWNIECDAPGAKEFRFCSVVVYTYPHQGIVNICSIMTNFEKSSSEI